MRPRLLLADGEPSIRESLRKLLQAEQYDVVLAVNGSQAVDTFRGDPTHFDLVLADLSMPVRNEWASIDRLLEVDPFLPIILLTGMPNQRQLAETSHVSALVEKPIDVPAFLYLMRALMDRIQACQLQGIPRGRQPFHYLPSHHTAGSLQHPDPYSHWGAQ